MVKNPLRLGGAGSRARPLLSGDRRAALTPVRLKIRFVRPQWKVVDERTGRALGDGRRFEVDWKIDEAAVISMATKAPSSQEK